MNVGCNKRRNCGRPWGPASATSSRWESWGCVHMCHHGCRACHLHVIECVSQGPGILLSRRTRLESSAPRVVGANTFRRHRGTAQPCAAVKTVAAPARPALVQFCLPTLLELHRCRPTTSRTACCALSTPTKGGRMVAPSEAWRWSCESPA